MQTYVVHSRHWRDLVKDLGWGGALMFQVVLMGMIIAPLLYAGFLIVIAVHALTGQLAWPYLQPWPLACLAVLLIGNGCAIATNIVGLRRTGQQSLWGWQALVPLHWLLIALATIRALYEFAVQPFHWFKTPHAVVDIKGAAAPLSKRYGQVVRQRRHPISGPAAQRRPKTGS